MSKVQGIRFGFVATLFALVGSNVAANELTAVSWGGALQEAQTKAFFEAYAKAKGVTVHQDTWSGELAKLRAMVDSGNVAWDVIDVDPQTGAIACEQGLLEKIGDEDRFKLLDLLDGALMECAVGSSTYATILAYQKDAFPEPPTRTTDIFDTKRFPGKRAFRRSPVDALEVALLADGVAPTDIYSALATEEGVERAFRKLDTIKADIVWWEAGAQPAQLIKSGEVKLALAWNGRITDANVNESADIGIAWSNQIRGFDMWSIPVGAKNADLARDFILFTVDPEINMTISQYISYGPTVRAANHLVPRETQETLPTAPEHSDGALSQDGEFWARYGDDLNARFSTWLSK